MRAFRSDRKPIVVRLDPRMAALLCAGVVILAAAAFASGVFVGRHLSTAAPDGMNRKVAAVPLSAAVPLARAGGASGSAHAAVRQPASASSPGSPALEKERLGALAAAADRAVVQLEDPAALDDATPAGSSRPVAEPSSAGSGRPANVPPAAVKEPDRRPVSQPAPSNAPASGGPSRAVAAAAPTAPPAARPEATGPPAPGSPPQEQPAAAHLRPAAGHPATVHFTLQVSSFQDQEEANELIRLLRSHGYTPYLIVSSVAERGQWYRVRVGKFSDRKAAEAFQAKFERQENLKAFVSPM